MKDSEKKSLETRVAELEALKAQLAALEAQLSVAQPVVHVIEGTEYERGWGHRPDGFVAFKTREAAEQWIADYNMQYNNQRSAPDEYTTYRYVGIQKCSAAFAQSMITGKPQHFHYLRDLQDIK